MIYITNRYNKYLYKERWDYDLAIVRYSKKPARKGEVQITSLAPSVKLLDWANDMKKLGKWNDGLFKMVYVPRFLEEMHEQSARDALNKLYLLGQLPRLTN